MSRRAQEIAESFINGNISWCREQLAGRPRLTCNVVAWLREYAPAEVDRFLRIMGRGR